MVYRLAMLCLILLPPHIVWGIQQNIEGVLRHTDDGTPLAGITVMLKSADNKIIAYSTSDSEGLFSLKAASDLEGAFIEVSHLAYKNKKVALASLEPPFEILLEENQIVLEEVVVKSRPAVTRLGDTLSYQVSAFATDHDRSIGDVLKRLPGVEVSESGQIKVGGKDISNFYIDGDDLLEDRYALGTRTIPLDMVENIEVLEHHEHVKALKNKRFTDNVAVNLVIKDEAKMALVGQAALGAGLPKEYEANVNAMRFNSKIKTLGLVEGNNRGRVLADGYQGLKNQSLVGKTRNSPFHNLLSVGTVSPPPISPDLYVMNNSVGASGNTLFHLPDSWAINTNLQVAYDQDNHVYRGRTQYSSPDGDLHLYEEQKTKNRNRLAALKLSGTKNHQKMYFDNSFSLEYQDALNSGRIDDRDTETWARKTAQINGFTNAFTYVPRLRNEHILRVHWTFDYGLNPQKLTVSPAAVPRLFNAEESYKELIQHMEFPMVKTTAGASYGFTHNRFIHSYGLSGSLENQKLRSDLLALDQSGVLVAPLDSAVNDLTWKRRRAAAFAKFDWVSDRFSSTVRLPVAVQHIAHGDPNYQSATSDQKLLVTPSIRLKYKISVEDLVSFNYTRNVFHGDPANLYRGLILNNYRSISRNTVGIDERSNHGLTMEYRTGKSVQLLFFNMGLTFNASSSNTILSNNITEESSHTTLVRYRNTFKEYGIRLGGDKYIFPLKGIFRLQAALTMDDHNQLFNGELLPFRNFRYTLNPSFETAILKAVRISYQANFGWNKARSRHVDNQIETQNFQASQTIGFPVMLFEVISIQTNARHLFSRQAGLEDFSYLFVDALFRYRIEKLDSDLELALKNLGNVRDFNTYALQANVESSSHYQLRGRSALLKMVFHF